LTVIRAAIIAGIGIGIIAVCLVFIITFVVQAIIGKNTRIGRRSTICFGSAGTAIITE
jgi:hypothetical protein